MTQDTNIENLIINKLTKAQYESIANPDPTQLYLTTDEVISSTDVVNALGYTPENVANKTTTLSSSSTDTQYPSAKAVYDQIANIDTLPSQTGQSGKFLTTNGTDASWGNLPVATASTVGTVKPDNSSIKVSNDGTISAICRNVGEIIQSSLPLTDAGLHLLDGARLSSDGIYGEFVQYIADLYSEEEETWTQPHNITSNGTLGGLAFACSQRETSKGDFYNCINGNADSSNFWFNTINSGEFIFYNPIALKITQMEWVAYDSNRVPTDYTVQGSNNGVNYTNIVINQTASAGSTTVMDLSSNTSYYRYYKLIVNSFNTGEGNCKTFNITATYIETPNYFTDETTWQTAITTYGSCGKFVYDSTNNTVRLPKVSDILQGTTDVSALGDLVEAGLPNIKGELNYLVRSTNTVNVGVAGAFYDNGDGWWQGGNNTQSRSNVGFDASRSSSIYGKSTTVQPQTIKAFVYIVIANSTKTSIQVDIDKIATDLNGKADVDLTNCTKPHVVETYQNGSSWYRVYSDGWCEQGGIFDRGSDITSSGGFTITLLKGYNNTLYTPIVINGGNSSGGGYGWHIAASDVSKTATSFSGYAWKYETSNRFINWETKGYIS